MADMLLCSQPMVFTGPLGSSALLSGDNIQVLRLHLRSWMQYLHWFISTGTHMQNHP